MKSAGLAASVPHPIKDTTELAAPWQMNMKPIDSSEVDSRYAPFMSHGIVTLLADKKKLTVRMLRDSEALWTLVRPANVAIFCYFRLGLLCGGWVC